MTSNPRWRTKIFAGIFAVLIPFAVYLVVSADQPSNPFFQAAWQRTDQPVRDGLVTRTWMWGPEANTASLMEPYAESPNGQREVQYYDKSRMEITNPNADTSSVWYVTNGLLINELMTGQLQLGDSTFESHAPAQVNVAGDADDTLGPTYASIAALRSAAPFPDGSVITQTVERNGTVGLDPEYATYNVTAAYRVQIPGIDHQVAGPFWDFMNSAGTVMENGEVTTAPLFTNPFFATGYPVTEAYWADIKVAGTIKPVLIQCFERRCLTYTPSNAPEWQVEQGNVGRHYYTWRYVDIVDTATPTAPSATATEPPPTNYVYASKFGQVSDPSRSLRLPQGIAFDSAGNMYIGDALNFRVQKYDSQGKYVTQWGSPGTGEAEFEVGTGEGEFMAPAGIAIDGAGDVYVVDQVNNRVLKYDQNGQHLTRWGSLGAGDGQFNRPTAIAIDSANNVYVTDTGNHRVQKFNSLGTYLTKWGVLGTADGQFNSPRGIAIAPDNAVYVTELENHRVQVFDQNGVYQRKWGSFGTGDDQFDTPWGVALSPDGTRVYIADTRNHRVQVTDTQGVFQASLGSPGSGAGQLDFPASIALHTNNVIYVMSPQPYEINDELYVRVQLLATTDGGYLGQITGDSRGRFIQPVGLALDTSGNIIVVDNLLDQVKLFGSDGSYVSQWGDPGTHVPPNLPLNGPFDVTRDSQGNLYVTDQLNDRVVTYNTEGQQIGTWGGTGAGNGQFNGGNGIAVDANDNVYVADHGNHRIQKFTSSGTFITAWGTLGNGISQFNGPGGVAISGSSVYVADQLNHRIQEFDLDGNYVRQWGSFGTNDGQFNVPAFIAVDAAGYVYVTDSGNSRVQKFTPEGAYLAKFGTLGAGDGQLDNPLGIAIDANANVVVVDSSNERVQIFSPAP